jgi:hypothetical protein
MARFEGHVRVALGVSSDHQAERLCEIARRTKTGRVRPDPDCADGTVRYLPARTSRASLGDDALPVDRDLDRGGNSLGRPPEAKPFRLMMTRMLHCARSRDNRSLAPFSTECLDVRSHTAT